jgi:ADP-ribose pyrophosphatase YjhB (NUDIX family)
VARSFCPSCGVPFPANLPLDEEGARTCTACGNVVYRQLKVGAAAIIERDGQILLLRRSEEPFKGSWGLPAGFVRWNESPEVAAIRETEEECGLTVQVRSLLGVYYFEDDPRGNGILIVYRCQNDDGTPWPRGEASEVAYFSRERLPRDLAGSGQDVAIRAWAG